MSCGISSTIPIYPWTKREKLHDRWRHRIAAFLRLASIGGSSRQGPRRSWDTPLTLAGEPLSFKGQGEPRIPGQLTESAAFSLSLLFPHSSSRGAYTKPSLQPMNNRFIEPDQNSWTIRS